MRQWLLGAMLPAAAVAAWEWLSRRGVLSEDGFSRPTRVASAAVRALADGSLLQQTTETFGAAALGLGIGALVAVACGTVLALMPFLRRAAALTIDVLRPVPSVALIPISLLIFGFGRNMSAAVAAFACFWPMLIVTISSVRGIDPRLMEVGRMLGLALPQRIWKLALPAAVPGIMVGLRVAAGIAIVVAVTTEIVANPQGLGHGMTMAAETLQADIVWATLLWIGVVGWTLNWAMLKLERRLLSWYWQERA